MEKKLGLISKIEEVKKTKKLNNNKGFSLIELLIVIAIMGVLAVIAFNMFGGVLLNSKKRADDQQARNIEKALLTYCVDSGDWKLAKMSTGGTNPTAITVNGKDSSELIEVMMDVIVSTVDQKEYGPLLSKKDPDKIASDEINTSAYAPQWNQDNGGEYIGWNINVYPSQQSIKVTPVKNGDAAGAKVVVKGTESTGGGE